MDAPYRLPDGSPAFHGLAELPQSPGGEHGRLLAYVDRSGGSLQGRMLRSGWAGVYVYSRPFQRLGSFRRLQAAARRHHRGVYARCHGAFHRPHV